jgi:hypothetical protein
MTRLGGTGFQPVKSGILPGFRSRQQRVTSRRWARTIRRPRASLRFGHNFAWRQPEAAGGKKSARAIISG